MVAVEWMGFRYFWGPLGQMARRPERLVGDTKYSIVLRMHLVSPRRNSCSNRALCCRSATKTLISEWMGGEAANKTLTVSEGFSFADTEPTETVRSHSRSTEIGSLSCERMNWERPNCGQHSQPRNKSHGRSPRPLWTRRQRQLCPRRRDPLWHREWHRGPRVSRPQLPWTQKRQLMPHC